MGKLIGLLNEKKILSRNFSSDQNDEETTKDVDMDIEKRDQTDDRELNKRKKMPF